jgi:hypothetical protein
LDADKLEMGFGSDGKARQLLANGNVRTERAAAGKPLQTATSHSGVAQLLPNGSWSQMDLQGDVKLKQADQSGQGDHAVFVQATQTATLTGKALARDAGPAHHFQSSHWRHSRRGRRAFHRFLRQNQCHAACARTC